MHTIIKMIGGKDYGGIFMDEKYLSTCDHQGFSDFINSTSDPEKAKGLCNAIKILARNL